MFFLTRVLILLILGLFFLADVHAENFPGESLGREISSFWLEDLEEAEFWKKAKVGLASWYGGRFHGRKTANGERYNKFAFTCASKTLPFGTVLEITNLKNQKTTVVRVNDRGPYIKKRVLDLSYAAAKKLGFVRSGVAKVAYRVLHEPKKR